MSETMEKKLKLLSKSLLGIYHWCKTEDISPNITEEIKSAQDKVYGELKTINPSLSNKDENENFIKEEITEMINSGMSNSDILSKFKDSINMIAGIRRAITKRNGVTLKIKGKTETFKSYIKAFQFLIEYLNKKYNKTLIRKHLENSGNYIHPQLILKGEPLKEMEERYQKTKTGYLYKNLSSKSILHRMKYLIENFNEDKDIIITGQAL